MKEYLIPPCTGCRVEVKAGQKVTFEVQTDLVIAVSACSISESKGNGGKCGAIKMTVEDVL